jgi:hypothetical protein
MIGEYPAQSGDHSIAYGPPHYNLTVQFITLSQFTEQKKAVR